MSGSILPSEAWPPYRWLWTTVVLGRDDDGKPIPYTHVMRRNPRLVIPAMVALAVVLVVYTGRRWWASLLAFGLGFLAGHVWW